MEHLAIHLPYEAMVGGPVQFRWMYSFESPILLLFFLSAAAGKKTQGTQPSRASSLEKTVSGSALLVRRLLLLGPKFWAFFWP
ncbi:hypothetical protein SLEP1_g37173 [Rubroshorea leprosula]|uniref:DUF4218 domain-containing protein n=1 Tax=Rubroshorea leprosula TaxID=152421 RepID=A0AAV5KU76_9ROSI|nr:hypothetical protein SLEP1_g37173 [Rubroshorea leprosula]